LIPRVELAWGRLLGRSGEAKESAQVFRKLIKDHPGSTKADDARLALASLLTDGSLPDAKDLPSAESLLAEVRKGGKGLPNGTAQVVELRLLVGKGLWEEALNLVDRMGSTSRDTQPEVKKLWIEAWTAWVDQRLEKGFPGELLTRLKPGLTQRWMPSPGWVSLSCLHVRGFLRCCPACCPRLRRRNGPDFGRPRWLRSNLRLNLRLCFGCSPPRGTTRTRPL